MAGNSGVNQEHKRYNKKNIKQKDSLYAESKWDLLLFFDKKTRHIFLFFWYDYQTTHLSIDSGFNHER